MSYEHKSNVNVRNFSIPTKFFIFVIIFLLLLCIIFPRFVSGLFIKIAGPFWGIEKDIKTEKIRVSIDLQNTTIQELEKENLVLKEIMDRNASSSPMILSYIVKKPPFTAYDSYIIDIGNNHNVKNGNKVYANCNVLLGEIVEINGVFAKVKLYSSYGEKFDVLIGKNDIEATATGRGGGAFEVVLPKDSRVQLGDSVLAPDLNVSVFGIVKNISIDPARSFSTILFSQPLNIYELKWVQVKIDK